MLLASSLSTPVFSLLSFFSSYRITQPSSDSPMSCVIRPHEASEKYDYNTSFFYSVVELHDWWLIEADEEFEGKKLAVAGFPDKIKGEGSVNKKPVIRVFKTAAITKVYDFCTLVAADGVCICLAGFLNKSRTVENGFSEEVFKHFVYGFPLNWETINYDSIRKDSKAAAESEANSFVATSSKDKDKSPDEKRFTVDNIVESLNEHDFLHTGNSAEVAPNWTGNMGADLCKAGPEAAQTGPPPCPGSPEGSSQHPVSIGKTPCGRMTRSRAAAESVKGVESTVNVDLSARRTSGKPIAEAGTPIRKNNVTAGGSFPGKKSKKMTDAERKNNKTEVSSRRKTPSKPKTESVAKSASTKRNDDGRKKELSSKRTKDSPQTVRSRDTVKQASPQVHSDSQGTLFSSPESFKRSRSGRALLPTLKFWKNQRPIYNADRSLAGIQEEGGGRHV